MSKGAPADSLGAQPEVDVECELGTKAVTDLAVVVGASTAERRQIDGELELENPVPGVDRSGQCPAEDLDNELFGDDE